MFEIERALLNAAAGRDCDYWREQDVFGCDFLMRWGRGYSGEDQHHTIFVGRYNDGDWNCRRQMRQKLEVKDGTFADALAWLRDPKIRQIPRLPPLPTP